MENLVEYLDESLVPLEEKIRNYLSVEHNIRMIEVELLSLQSIASDFTPDSDESGQHMAKEQLHVKLNDKEKRMGVLLEQYKTLRQEVINMLPEQNKFFELNLGYGPSMVGYFTVDHETRQPLSEPVLRIVH
ncbi:hypothetical protein MKJ04_06790 [Pontibacter sp. E15-1]|uniref:hypothetical protein n=1 Tax=Pontibacter sp. E15-1 TaxID=2919918 RepID=UPI001F4F46BD|nr:hypothetical protein [Pontibacter sp. E15-1]MCJ8164548.1 hypothetical protein [Pontibacter sp. E15-1]